MTSLMGRITAMRQPKESVEIPEEAEEVKLEEPDQPEKTEPEKVEPEASAGEVAQLCSEAGVPYMTDALLKEGLDLDGVRSRVADMSKIRESVTLARKANPTIGMGVADQFIRNGATRAEAGETLLEMLANSQSEEIVNTHTPDARPSGSHNIDHGWGDAVAKVFGRKEA